MRILLAHHAPLDSDTPGSQALGLARSMQAAGHRPRILTIGDKLAASDGVPTSWVVADSDNPVADLPYVRPRFTSSGQPPDFCGLTSEELDFYRQVLRQRLDQEVHDFDPHVIHCQHIWIFAHLALETGAPYVITAHADELDAMPHDSRYQQLAHQAAENAGRILVASKDLAARVRQTLPVSPERVLVVAADDVQGTVGAYRAVLYDRGIVCEE